MSQSNDIRDYLLIAGNSLTPLEALQRFDCISLGQRIYDLKKFGWQFKEEWEKHGKKKVKRFRIVNAMAVAGLIPVHFMNEMDIKQLYQSDSDMTEETTPEDVSSTPNISPMQLRLL